MKCGSFVSSLARRVPYTLACFVMIGGLIAGPADPGFEGRWVGLLTDSGNFANVGFEFKSSDDGMQALFFSDDMDFPPTPTGKATFQERTIKSLLFTGTLSPDGKTLQGTMDFKGFGMDLKLPLSLTRTEAGASSPGVAPAVGGTAKERWAFSTGAPVYAAPLVTGDTLYIGSDDAYLYALDAKTGGEKWRFDTKGIVQASPVISPSGLLLIGSRHPYVFALDSETGKENWRFNYLGSWVESSAAIAGDTAYIGSSDFVHMFAIDMESGRRKWGFKTSGYAWSSPVVADGIAYIGNACVSKRHKESAADFYAVEVKTGRELWRFRTGRTPGQFIQGVVSSPTVTSGLVYFGSLDGKVYAIPAGQ